MVDLQAYLSETSMVSKTIRRSIILMVENCSTREKNEALIHATAWKNLDSIMLNERSQT